MSRQKTTLSELRVGILTLATIAILIVFFLSVTGDISLFKDTMTITTRFGAAEGLKSGDEVRLAGKRVGRVESVDFGEVPTSKDDKPILVTMTLDGGESRDRIRTDSQAVLGQQGFLGDRVIDITAGTTAGQPVPDGAEIPSADVVGMTEVFGGANDLLVAFNTVARQIESVMDDVQQGKGNIGKFLQDDQLYINLNRTVVESQHLLKRIQEGEGTVAKFLNDPGLYNELRSLSNDARAMADDVRAGKGTIGKLLVDERLFNQLQDAMTKTNTALEKIERITAEVESGRGTIGKLVKDEKLHDDVQAAMGSLRSISARLDAGEGTAGRLLKDEQLYNNVNQMSGEVVKLLYDFRQNPKKYLSIKISLF